MFDKLTEEDVKAIIFGDHGEFDPVTEEEMYDGGRWWNGFSRVFKHDSGRFLSVGWTQGATEYQDEGPENITWDEVEPYEKTVICYRVKS